MFLVQPDRISCLLDMGLGNRIKHLAAALRIAEDHQKPLKVWWVLEGFGASFSEVFEPVPGVEVFEIQTREDLPAQMLGYETGSWLWYLEHEILEDRRKPFQDSEVGGVVQRIPAHGFKVYEPFHWITPSLQNLYLPYFDRIRFRTEHHARTDAVFKGLDEEPMVGMHIRCADDMMIKISKVGMAAPLSATNVAAQARAMIKKNKKGNVFLATDRESFIQEMSEQLGSQMITHPKWLYSRGSSEDIFTAIEDMIMLSRCHNLVLSYSSFGQCSWWMGQCPPAVRLGEV